jgi:hypothetical protein
MQHCVFVSIDISVNYFCYTEFFELICFLLPSDSLSDDDHHDFQRVDPVLGINFASTSDWKYFECIIMWTRRYLTLMHYC